MVNITITKSLREMLKFYPVNQRGFLCSLQFNDQRIDWSIIESIKTNREYKTSSHNKRD